jgi:pyrroline-5-carboxylate reductase
VTAGATAAGPVSTLLLVGCGKMGGALLRGWHAAGVARRYIVVEPQPLPAALAALPGIEQLRDAAGISAGLRPDATVLAVKPQTLGDLLPAYRAIGADGLTLSIAAGKTLTYFARQLGEGRPLVRAMPNTPAAIGRGISVACANKFVSTGQRDLAQRLLAAAGEVCWVEDEALMDAVTAVSGSGPAYLFLLVECLAAAGVAAGLPADLAARLALATMAGAGELARQAPESAAQLRENVTSPGGTTRAALDVLMAPDGLAPLLQRAVLAATARSRQLAE